MSRESTTQIRRELALKRKESGIATPRNGVSKYDPKYCELLIKHLEQGHSFTSFGGVINVVNATLYRWLKEFPEFSNVKSIGDAKSLLFFEKRAVSIVSGQEVDGIKFNLVSQRMLEFFLRTRFHKEYSERKQGEAGEMSVEEFIRQIKKKEELEGIK